MPAPWPSASAIATRFATHWIADALAGDESIEFSVLQALVQASSEPLAGAPEATRERVALRSLQEVSSLIAAGGDAAAAAGVFRVDGARSCEDVLSRLIRQVEISGNLEKDLLPPFSQDIQETIRTKKFTLPETSFQLLKGVDSWMTSMTPPSQLEQNGNEQCDNDQTLHSSHECINIGKPVFPTDNAEVLQEALANLVNESETGNLQKHTSAPTSVLHQPCTPESRSYAPPQEDTMDAVGLGDRSPERSPIVEGNMSVGSVLASAGRDASLQGSITDTTMMSQPDSRKAHLQHERGEKVNQDLEDVSASIRPVEKDHIHGDLTLQSASVLLSMSCNGANQVSQFATNLQPGTATEDRMDFEEQNADKSHLEVSGANKADQALHDDGSIMKNNIVLGGLTAQTAPVSQNCNVTLHDKTSEANCFSEQKNEENRTDVQKDNCRTSIPSSSKDRDRESAKKTSNEEKSDDTSPKICVPSKDQDIDDTLEGLSQQDLCIKCGKDGQLLKCSDCFLAAHDRCFGSSVTFEGTDLFYCPVCLFKKARETYEKAKTTYCEARENLAAFVGTAQVVKQHDEQLTGVQPGAANRDGHSNGCDISKRNNIHQNETCDLAHRDEEPHQPRKKQKINARGNGYPKEVLTEEVPFQNSGPASMNKHSVLQNNSKTRVEDPEKKQQAGDKEARKEPGNDNSSHKRRASSQRRCDPPSNQDVEADQEDSLSNQTGGSDELEATSSNGCGKRSLPPWRNMRHDRKRLHEKESAVPSKSRKGTAKEDQHMPSSPRKRSSVHPHKRYSNPVAPTGRRDKINWTTAEEAVLREGMAKFTPQDGAQIPWVRILKYGRHVFHKTRIATDLKSKWRNLKKKEEAGY